MGINRGRLRREYLAKEAKERQEARDSIKPLDQLKRLKRRGVTVPGLTVDKILSVDESSFCKEVQRLVREIRSQASPQKK